MSSIKCHRRHFVKAISPQCGIFRVFSVLSLDYFRFDPMPLLNLLKFS
jgi:hypothetical protein